MTERNTPPNTIWQALRRLLLCNKQQLAERLNVNRHTLTRWEAATESGSSAGPAAERAAADLLRETLQAANAKALTDQ